MRAFVHRGYIHWAIEKAKACHLPFAWSRRITTGRKRFEHVAEAGQGGIPQPVVLGRSPSAAEVGLTRTRGRTCPDAVNFTAVVVEQHDDEARATRLASPTHGGSPRTRQRASRHPRPRLCQGYARKSTASSTDRPSRKKSRVRSTGRLSRFRRRRGAKQ